MKFKDYLQELQKLAADNPFLLEKEVVYACDDEGNWFGEITFTPSARTFLMDNGRVESVISDQDIDEYLDEGYTLRELVCVN